MQVTVKQIKNLGDYQSLTIELSEDTERLGMTPNALIAALRSVIAHQFGDERGAQVLLEEALREEELGELSRTMAIEIERVVQQGQPKVVTNQRAAQVRFSLVFLGFTPEDIAAAEYKATEYIKEHEL